MVYLDMLIPRILPDSSRAAVAGQLLDKRYRRLVNMSNIDIDSASARHCPRDAEISFTEDDLTRMVERSQVHARHFLAITGESYMSS